MIFKDTYEDLTPERLAEILDEFEAGKGDKVKPGPQVDRFFSAPASGLTSLEDEKPLKKAANGKAAKAAGVSDSASKPALATASSMSVPPSNAAKPKNACRSDQ